MHMINVLNRLAELDEGNKNVINPMVKDKKTKEDRNSAYDGYQGGAPDTQSVVGNGNEENPDPAGKKHNGIGGSDNRNNEGKIMKELDVNSLRYLSGINEALEECGMMPMDGAQSRGHASINITADNGPELSGMLKDIMNLAGVHKVEMDHMPIEKPDAGPSKLVASPVLSQGQEMKDLIKTLDGMEGHEDSKMLVHDDEEEFEEDRMNGHSHRAMDNSPDEELLPGTFNRIGDGDQNAVAAKDELVDRNRRSTMTTRESTLEKLLADYAEFIAEAAPHKPKWLEKAQVKAELKSGQKISKKERNKVGVDESRCNHSPKGKMCPVHGMKECSGYMESTMKDKCCCKTKGKTKCPVHGNISEEMKPYVKAGQKKFDAQTKAQQSSTRQAGTGVCLCDKKGQDKCPIHKDKPMDEGKNWVKKAVQGTTKGALRKQEGKKKDEKFSKSELKSLAKTGTPKEKKRAQFALNISKK